MASASFEKMAGDRKSYRIGNFHNATNLSSRSIHLAGLSVAGFLRIFPQCARSRHTVPQRGTPIIVYRQQFPFHGICNWNPIDRGWRTPRNSTYRTSSFLWLGLFGMSLSALLLLIGKNPMITIGASFLMGLIG